MQTRRSETARQKYAKNGKERRKKRRKGKKGGKMSGFHTKRRPGENLSFKRVFKGLKKYLSIFGTDSKPALKNIKYRDPERKQMGET